MGGVMAQTISRICLHKVCQIVTLGAPFWGSPFANSAWRIYEQLSGYSLSPPVVQAQIAERKSPPPVLSVSLFSKSDSVVAWQWYLKPKYDLPENIEVTSAHCGFGFSACVLRVPADILVPPDCLAVAS